MACGLLIGRPMAPRARPGLEVGWATPAVRSLPPKAGRGLCAALARAGALCFEPDVEKNTKFTPQTHNTRQRNNILIGCERSAHVPARSPGGESAARWSQARAKSAYLAVLLSEDHQCSTNSATGAEWHCDTRGRALFGVGALCRMQRLVVV